jgi:hypothetical protein
MTKPGTVIWLPLRRLLRSWCDQVFMVVVIVASALAFMSLDSRGIRPSRVLKPDEQPGSGVIVRDEVLHLWLPESLLDLPGHQSEPSLAQTHQELRSSLERRGRENVWYALTIRSHVDNGEMADITFIRHPYSDAEHFQELLDVLSTAAGNPPRGPTSNYSNAAVHILPGELSERKPREVIEELLSPPSQSSELSQ